MLSIQFSPPVNNRHMNLPCCQPQQAHKQISLWAMGVQTHLPVSNRHTNVPLCQPQAREHTYLSTTATWTCISLSSTGKVQTHEFASHSSRGTSTKALAFTQLINPVYVVKSSMEPMKHKTFFYRHTAPRTLLVMLTKTATVAGLTHAHHGRRVKGFCQQNQWTGCTPFSFSYFFEGMVVMIAWLECSFFFLFF